MTFYRTVVVPLVAVTIICALQVLQSQTMLFVFRVFWVKIFTSFLIGAYIAIFRSEQFVFFNNLGYPRNRLLIYVFLMDFLVWLLLMTMVSLFL